MMTPPMLSELEAVRHGGRDFLGGGADLDAMNVAVFAQAVVDEIDDARGDGEAQALAASAFGEDESVDAEDGGPFISD